MPETKVSLIIDRRQSNRAKTSKSIPNVSASATDDQLYDFAYDFNALSTYTFIGVSRVEKRELEANTNG